MCYKCTHIWKLRKLRSDVVHRTIIKFTVFKNILCHTTDVSLLCALLRWWSMTLFTIERYIESYKDNTQVSRRCRSLSATYSSTPLVRHTSTRAAALELRNESGDCSSHLWSANLLGVFLMVAQWPLSGCSDSGATVALPTGRIHRSNIMKSAGHRGSSAKGCKWNETVIISHNSKRV